MIEAVLKGDKRTHYSKQTVTFKIEISMYVCTCLGRGIQMVLLPQIYSAMSVLYDQGNTCLND